MFSKNQLYPFECIYFESLFHPSKDQLLLTNSKIKIKDNYDESTQKANFIAKYL